MAATGFQYPICFQEAVKRRDFLCIMGTCLVTEFQPEFAEKKSWQLGAWYLLLHPTILCTIVGFWKCIKKWQKEQYCGIFKDIFLLN